MFFPFEKEATINADGLVGQVFDGIKVDRVTRVEKGLEVGYTVVDPKLFDKLRPSRVECSMAPRREGNSANRKNNRMERNCRWIFHGAVYVC